ncbi:MAG: VWA domain-containing protein, partial [Thermomicrobiales bacterium]
MPYAAEISRSNPSCFLFLVDQSGSMEDGWAGEAGKQKADGLATIINRLLQNLVLKCAKSEGVRDYYHVGVIGYGGDGTANRVGAAFVGPLAGRDLAPLSDIANNPARIEERTK